MFIQQAESGRVRLVTSASDLTAASSCEFAFLRRVDARLGRDVLVPTNDDPMLARAGQLGDIHEDAELARLRVERGDGITGEPGGVVSIPGPASMSEEDLTDVAEQTVRALRGKADVVFQATFFDPEHAPSSPDAVSATEPTIGFIGFADFLELRPDGSYEVQDTKLARRAKVTALMQLAAYAEQLERLSIPVSPVATLILGSGERSTHRIADIAPVFRRRRARLHELLLSRYAEVGPDGRRESAAGIAWGADGITACGRCEVCEPEVVRTRDPLLIAGMRPRQRDALRAAGLDTIDAIAEALPSIESRTLTVTGRTVPGLTVPGLTSSVLENIAMQAAVQVAADQGSNVGGPPPIRVIAAEQLSAIPEPNPGDLFFDFEGDPFYRETGDDGVARWNLDYLFGMVDTDEHFTPLWAHSLAEEKRALQEFIALVVKRRRLYPGMHIYHYATYERTHLLSIAARHGVCEKEVDELLRENVLVDLYPIVRRSLRVGSRSYSIKKLEPLYMGDELRDVDGVTDGGQSVVEYAEASAQLESPDPGEQASGQARLNAIADYNRYDCVSTLRLRDWLLGIAREHGVASYPTELLAPSEVKPVELSEVGGELLNLAEGETDPELRTALKLASSAIDYHEREHKAFWWAHFARLTDPLEDWADTRDVLVVEAGDSEVADDWHTPPRAHSERRRVRLRGVLAPGSTFKAGSDAFALYELPAPFATAGSAPGARAVKRVKIVERYADGATIEEPLGAGNTRYAQLPIAITPGPPPHAGRQKSAIEEWGRAFATAQAGGRKFEDPVVELLLRAKPRLVGGADSALVRPESAEALRVGGSDELRTIGAVVASVRRLDSAALAVQGPPGTGKTYLAARVLRQLVEENGWRIGVVAQSHRVVENVLEGVVAAGLDPRLVGKVPQGGSRGSGEEQPGFTVLRKDGHAAFLAEHAERGAVIGGTAWDFAHEGRIARKSLDLLVIDEAGQFSLAPTIAASVAAKRLLLLGDQQQLPQVSQGAHPEPVDTSALSWLLGDHDTMPEGHGYFLADTRRMHPELASVVSELSYDGRLKAHPSTLARVVVGAVGPGLHWRGVEHRGDSTHSMVEAAAIASAVGEMLSAELRTFDGPFDGAFDGAVCGQAAVDRRMLTEDDIIVVAAYNAQVECITEALSAAGHPRVRVGTVDRFQGQEAVISLVSLAASSADDVPRGLEFLLMRNRLNVAISRAQWAAILFSSTKLGDGLPSSVDGVAALSGYLRLTERG